LNKFFVTYKRLEPHKFVKFKTWKNAEEAKKIIEYAVNLYKKKSIKK